VSDLLANVTRAFLLTISGTKKEGGCALQLQGAPTRSARYTYCR
jgi:hypothetical protein